MTPEIIAPKQRTLKMFGLGSFVRTFHLCFGSRDHVCVRILHLEQLKEGRQACNVLIIRVLVERCHR